MNNISQKSYVRNKLLVYGHTESKMESSFLPAFVVSDSKEKMFFINGVSISVNASIEASTEIKFLPLFLELNGNTDPIIEIQGSR